MQGKIERSKDFKESPDQSKNVQYSWKVIMATKSFVFTRIICENFKSKLKEIEETRTGKDY